MERTEQNGQKNLKTHPYGRSHILTTKALDDTIFCASTRLTMLNVVSEVRHMCLIEVEGADIYVKGY